MAHRKSVSTRATPSRSRRFGRPGAAGTSPPRPRRSLGSAKSPSRTATQGGSPAWRPGKSPKSQSKLSKLTKSVQSALPSKSTKTAKNTSKGSRRSAPALALLAGSAAAALGGRQLQKRKQSAQPEITDVGYTNPVSTSAPSPSGSSSPASVDAVLTERSNLADHHHPAHDATLNASVMGQEDAPYSEHPKPPGAQTDRDEAPGIPPSQ